MPPAEVEVASETVSCLLADQRPDLEHSKVRPLAFGWDNFSFRVGEDQVARLPRREMSVALVHNEARWLPELRTRLPLPVPAPTFLGEPGCNYPWPWTIVPWIDGIPVSVSDDLELEAAAEDLAGFLSALHQAAPHNAPTNPYRGIPIQDLDTPVRRNIGRLDSGFDAISALDLWAGLVDVTEHAGPPVWVHGDLHPNNLLAVDGRLSGVIDFGDMTAGDPATDLAVAWMLFSGDKRAVFREAYGAADEATWQRARGWALSLGATYLANSADNETMAAVGTVTWSGRWRGSDQPRSGISLPLQSSPSPGR